MTKPAFREHGCIRFLPFLCFHSLIRLVALCKDDGDDDDDDLVMQTLLFQSTAQ